MGKINLSDLKDYEENYLPFEPIKKKDKNKPKKKSSIYKNNDEELESKE